MADEKKVDIEKSLQELHQIVEQMEQGTLSLEQSLKTFERGIQLTRSCQNALQDAQAQVKILLEQSKEGELDDFNPTNDDD